MTKDLKVAVIGLDGANKKIADLVGIKFKIVEDMISTIPPFHSSIVDIYFNRR